MKILIIGDFHGKCNIPMKRVLKEEDIDMILSPGDYCGNEKVAELIFKHWYGKDDDEVPRKIMKKIREYETMGVRAGFDVVKKLRDLKVPFLGVRGNWDPVDYPSETKIRSKDMKDAKGLLKMQREHFRFVDFKVVDCGEFVVVGGASSSYPAKIDKKSLERFDLKSEKNRAIKRYEKRKKLYEKAFLKAREIGKPVIFLTHNCPYESKLDKIKKGPQKGKHYGNFLEKQIIRRFKPEVVICGHMHENQGRDKIGETVLINAGAVLEKKFAVLDFDEKKGKVRRVGFSGK